MDITSFIENLPALYGVTVLFLLQFATLIWRISKAEANIEKRIQDVEAIAKLELERFKLFVSETYLKNDTYRFSLVDMNQHMIRLEAKLDAAIQIRYAEKNP